MSTSRKPTLAFWTVVALTVPVLYVASFGPACWLAWQIRAAVTFGPDIGA